MVMNCNQCKQEIELNQEAQIRNDHVFHECCAMTYDKDEKFIFERDLDSQ
jgi:hypothetical protein